MSAYTERYTGPDKVLTPADWKDADYVSAAINLSGVAHSFPEVIRKVRQEAEARGQDWDWANHHPLIVIYADKIATLAFGNETFPDIAYDAYGVLLARLKETP